MSEPNPEVSKRLPVPPTERAHCAVCHQSRLLGQLRKTRPSSKLPEWRICLCCYDQYRATGYLHPSLWARPPS